MALIESSLSQSRATGHCHPSVHFKSPYPPRVYLVWVKHGIRTEFHCAWNWNIVDRDWVQGGFSGCIDSLEYHRQLYSMHSGIPSEFRVLPTPGCTAQSHYISELRGEVVNHGIKERAVCHRVGLQVIVFPVCIATVIPYPGFDWNAFSWNRNPFNFQTTESESIKKNGIWINSFIWLESNHGLESESISIFCLGIVI